MSRAKVEEALREERERSKRIPKTSQKHTSKGKSREQVERDFRDRQLTKKKTEKGKEDLKKRFQMADEDFKDPELKARRDREFEEEREREPIGLGEEEERPTIKLGAGGEPEIDRSVSGQLERLRSGESFGGNPLARILGDPNTTPKLLALLTGLTIGKGLYKAGKPGNSVKVGGKFFSNPKTDKQTQVFLTKIFEKTSVAKKRIRGKLVTVGQTTETTSKLAGAGAGAGAAGTAAKGLTVGQMIGVGGIAMGLAGGLMTIIGTYPFAGFIKEEALQTASHGYKSSFDAGDFEGAQAAIDERTELLNPSVWQELMAWIPFKNVKDQLNAYYKADTQTLANQQEALNRAIEGEPTLFEIQQGQREEREGEGEGTSLDLAKEKSRIFEESQARQNEAELELAKEKNRLFAISRDEERQKELAQRIEESEYFKNLAKGKTSTQKSSLSFGLLNTILTLLIDTKGGE